MPGANGEKGYIKSEDKVLLTECMGCSPIQSKQQDNSISSSSKEFHLH